MGYKFVPKFLENNNQTGLGIDYNFKAAGIFTTNYDNNQQAIANLKNLLLTLVGERYHNIFFGSELPYIIFEPNVNELKEDISEIIISAVSRWLPYINIMGIDIITGEDDPNLNHNIQITIRFTTNSIDESKIVIFAEENGILTIE